MVTVATFWLPLKCTLPVPKVVTPLTVEAEKVTVPSLICLPAVWVSVTTAVKVTASSDVPLAAMKEGFSLEDSAVDVASPLVSEKLMHHPPTLPVSPRARFAAKSCQVPLGLDPPNSLVRVPGPGKPWVPPKGAATTNGLGACSEVGILSQEAAWQNAVGLVVLLAAVGL